MCTSQTKVQVLILPEGGYRQWPKHVGVLYVKKLVQFVGDKLFYK